MEDLSIWDKNVHQWRIQPGSVGSVGDVVVTPRLKQSCPDMYPRWAEWARGPNAPYLGSNVQDGSQKSFDDGGGGPVTIDERWGGRRNFRTNVGWKVQDLTQPDTLVEPFVSSLGDYSWRNKVATIYEAKRSGENFLPLPGEYTLARGEISRGGSQVRVTDIIPGDQPLIEPQVVNRPLRAGVTNQGLQYSEHRNPIVGPFRTHTIDKRSYR